MKSTWKTSIHLMYITQRRDEDLSEYIKRFNEESLKVFDLLDIVAFTALVSRFYSSSRFKLKLAESEAFTFCEAMNFTQNFIQPLTSVRLMRNQVQTKESTSMLLERTPQGMSLAKKGIRNLARTTMGMILTTISTEERYTSTSKKNTLCLSLTQSELMSTREIRRSGPSITMIAATLLTTVENWKER